MADRKLNVGVGSSSKSQISLPQSEMNTSIKRNPTDFLKQIMGRLVGVKLHNGTEFVGVLATFDGLMNIVLQQAEEYENAELKQKYSEIFIRGNNVLYLQQKQQKPAKKV